MKKARYEIICQVCDKRSYVTAKTSFDAIQEVTEKGWSALPAVNDQGKQYFFIACFSCKQKIANEGLKNIQGEKE